jgi:predicted nucleic acid-binding protein
MDLMIAENARAAMGAFDQHLQTGVFESVALSVADYSSARELCWEVTTPVRTLDALHMAVAARLKATLVAADDRMLTACSEIGLEVVDIRILT